VIDKYGERFAGVRYHEKKMVVISRRWTMPSALTNER